MHYFLITLKKNGLIVGCLGPGFLDDISREDCVLKCRIKNILYINCSKPTNKKNNKEMAIEFGNNTRMNVIDVTNNVKIIETHIQLGCMILYWD